MFHRYTHDPEVVRYLTWEAHQDIADTHAFLDHCDGVWDAGEAFPFAVVEQATGEVVGVVEPRLAGDRVTLGYVFARDVWGRGYATEAVEAIIRWACGQPGLRWVDAITDTENVPSARVLEKAGLRRMDLRAGAASHPNVSADPRDCWFYEMELQPAACHDAGSG